MMYGVTPCFYHITADNMEVQIRVALREAAASLAAADAAQRRAESRESTAQRTLEAQRELWKQREREYSQVLRAAELTLTTMRKRTADFDEV
jgi:hypothetical protein